MAVGVEDAGLLGERALLELGGQRVEEVDAGAGRGTGRPHRGHEQAGPDEAGDHGGADERREEGEDAD